MDSQIKSRYVTADALICRSKAQILCAYVVPSGATTNTYIYNGNDANGEVIIPLNAAVATNHPFKPVYPVICNKGIYIDIGTNVTGVFIQWQELTE